ncbi:sugar transferase [Sphingomonas flavalba]|uniref:sugar transferase n=1 Tax=Sphingomonas flavalba TaxID=2559804 RepID=UPI0039E1EDF3
MKRAFDLVLALLLLPFALIGVFLFSVLILFDDGANPLFLQQRVGQDGKLFTLFKLRTMRVGSPNVPSHVASSSQFTRLGRFLRSAKIDELPQIWNVVTGDMSFVGPRPCLPSQHELIACRARLGLSGLRPGITGPAQVKGIDMRDPARLAEADAVYLGRWSLARDIGYIAATAIGSGSGDAVKGS